MRDPARIPTVLADLQRAWLKHPDWRLGQLIENAKDRNRPTFYIEDDLLLAGLQQLAKD